jgi:hypothetical protein
MGAAIVGIALWLKVWGFGLILLSVWWQRTIDGMCSLAHAFGLAAEGKFVRSQSQSQSQAVSVAFAKKSGACVRGRDDRLNLAPAPLSASRN